MARQIETTDMKTDEQIIEELRAACAGLRWMSESDYPLEVIRWERREEVTPEFLRGLTGDDSSTPVETRSPAELFRAAASEAEWKSETELASAAKFRAVRRLLEENLEDVKVYRVGEINMAVYVMGRSPEANWLGLKTRIVET